MIDEWDISMARETLRTEQDINQYIQSILYRLYDKRSIFYHDDLVARPRRAVMKHLIAGNNIAMCVGRAGQAVEDTTWNLVSISDVIVDLNIFRRGGNLVFPLCCYQEQGEQKYHNLSQQYWEEVCRHLNYENEHATELRFIHDGKGNCKTTIGPEDIFYYIYAILHAPSYRQRYADQLKIDFPHIPLTINRPLFQKLVLSGEQLVEAQLFQSRDLNLPTFPVNGDPQVEGGRWIDGDQRVWINQTQYFEPVSQEVWEFRVGGHQPAKKWLNDRKSRSLRFDEIQHYSRICGALGKTVEVMETIDWTIAEHGGWPLENRA